MAGNKSSTSIDAQKLGKGYGPVVESSPDRCNTRLGLLAPFPKS